MSLLVSDVEQAALCCGGGGVGLRCCSAPWCSAARVHLSCSVLGCGRSGCLLSQWKAGSLIPGCPFSAWSSHIPSRVVLQSSWVYICVCECTCMFVGTARSGCGPSCTSPPCCFSLVAPAPPAPRGVGALGFLSGAGCSGVGVDMFSWVLWAGAASPMLLVHGGCLRFPVALAPQLGVLCLGLPSLLCWGRDAVVIGMCGCGFSWLLMGCA